MAGPLGVLSTLDKYNLDVLVMLTFASFHLPAIAGLPAVTVPLGFFPADTAVEMNLKGTIVNIAPKIPFGLAFVGRRWSEETPIGLAYAFEKRTMARQKIKPYISPIFELGNQISSGLEREGPAQQPGFKHKLTLSETMQAILKRGIRGVFSTGSWAWTLLGIFASIA